MRSRVHRLTAHHAKPQSGPADSLRERGGKRQRRGVEKAATACCWRNNAWIGVLSFAAEPQSDGAEHRLVSFNKEHSAPVLLDDRYATRGLEIEFAF